MVTLRSAGTRTHYRLVMDLSVLSPQGRRRVTRAMIRAALPRARKEIATPAKRKTPRRTGALRRSLRASRVRPQYRAHFTLLQFKFRYYYYFHEAPWRAFRERIEDNVRDIALDALHDALRYEGFR